MKFRFLVLPFLAALVAGCSSVSVDRHAKVDLSKVKHVFVERRLNDNHSIDQLLVAELKKLGREASSGPITMMPDDAEAVLAYDDEWTFDFTTHMTVLQVRLRDVKKESLLASGSFVQRSVARNSPEDIVHRVLTELFQPKK